MLAGRVERRPCRRQHAPDGKSRTKISMYAKEHHRDGESYVLILWQVV